MWNPSQRSRTTPQLNLSNHVSSSGHAGRAEAGRRQEAPHTGSRLLSLHFQLQCPLSVGSVTGVPVAAVSKQGPLLCTLCNPTDAGPIGMLFQC
jgi:hypothetical protein